MDTEWMPQKASQKAAQFRDNHSPKGKARRKAWGASEKGKESLKAATLRLTTKRRAWVQAEKVRLGCVDCGYNKHPAALDFDHVSGTKLFDISKTMGRRLDVMKAEIAKCVVRCSNCHRIKTFEARQKSQDKRTIDKGQAHE